VQQSRQYEADGGVLAPQAPIPRKTIFELAPLTTGPTSTIQSVGSRIPVVGGLMENAAVTQAKSYLDVVTKDIVRVLQNNPRYAEGERQAITNDLKLALGLIDRPERMRNALIGLDDALSEREQNAIETLRNPAVGRDEYTHTLNMLNSVTKIRRTLGVPPLVTTAEDVKKYQPGTLVRLPDGSVKRIKQ
jgi:hypothetical protein